MEDKAREARFAASLARLYRQREIILRHLAAPARPALRDHQRIWLAHTEQQICDIETLLALTELRANVGASSI